MLKLGTNNIDSIYLGSTEIEKAYLGNDLVYQKGEPVVDYSTKYLTLTAFESSTISVKANNSTPNIPTIWYSTNDGGTWTQVSVSTTATNLATLSNGESVLLKGTQSGTSSTGYVTISGTGNFAASGNVMSLIYGDSFIGQKSLTGKDYAFMCLFYQSSKLVDIDNIVLPATTLAPSCYRNMFRNTSITSAQNLELPAMTLTDSCYRMMFRQCSLLTIAPELPATTLGDYCYHYMFEQCPSLTNIPSILPATTLTGNCYTCMFTRCTSLTNVSSTLLPATTLTASCYESMFNGCSSLTTAPELPATTLASSCYNGMFLGCKSLTEAPELPATTLVSRCYNSLFYLCSNLKYIKAMFITTPSSNYSSMWVSGVSSSGTFVKNSAATWNVTGNNGIPTGWTVQTASADEGGMTVNMTSSTSDLGYFGNGYYELVEPCDSQTLSNVMTAFENGQTVTFKFADNKDLVLSQVDIQTVDTLQKGVTLGTSGKEKVEICFSNVLSNVIKTEIFMDDPTVGIDFLIDTED